MPKAFWEASFLVDDIYAKETGTQIRIYGLCSWYLKCGLGLPKQRQQSSQYYLQSWNLATELSHLFLRDRFFVLTCETLYWSTPSEPKGLAAWKGLFQNEYLIMGCVTNAVSFLDCSPLWCCVMSAIKGNQVLCIKPSTQHQLLDAVTRVPVRCDLLWGCGSFITAFLHTLLSWQAQATYGW